MQESCLIIGLAEIGNAVTANFSRSCSIAVPLHRVQNFSFPILNDFDSRRRQSYSRDYCSCFSTCNGVRWSECSGSFISGQDACSVKSKYLISVFASFAYVRNIIIVNVVDNGKIRCCFRENMCYLRSCCVSIEAGSRQFDFLHNSSDSHHTIYHHLMLKKRLSGYYMWHGQQQPF